MTMTGKTHSAETRAKISAALKGHQQSEETRAKISAAMRGKLTGAHNPNYGHRRLFAEVGQRFGRGVVIEPEIRLPVRNRRGARLRCDCGAVYEAALAHLFGGITKSCGCLQRARAALAGRQTRTHGLTHHPLYVTWAKMMARCYSAKDISFERYGGRGIKVCADWHDVRTFIAWIETNLGPRPEGMTLDRIDNDGNYEPGNVRWATPKEQSNNRHPRRWQRKPAAYRDLAAEITGRQS